MKLLKNNFLTCVVIFFSALYPSITLGTWVFPTIVFAVLFILVLKKPFFEIKRKTMLYIYLSIPFIILYKFFRVDVDNGFVLTSLAYVLAQYLVTVQILHVISPQKNSREIIFFCSLFCIICAQDVFQKREFIHLSMLGVLFFFYLFYINADWFSRVKKEGYGRVFLVITFAVFFTFITVSVAIFSFGAVYRPLEYYMVRMVYGRILSKTMDAAFLQSSIIGSIPEYMWKFNRDKVNLRVFSLNSPGYLKAKTYLRYDMGKWSNPGNSKSKVPAVRDGDEIRYIINNREDAGSGLQKATIFKERSIGNVIFTGKNPVEIVSESKKIERDNYGNLFDVSSKPPILYHLYESGFRRNCFHPEKYMEIPYAIEGKLKEKAFEITKGEKNERTAVAAIRSYFSDNYTYELGVSVAGKIDPVLDFLYNKRKGHCEYFASSTVLLLRSSGIPARYVTGFLVNEKNRLGNYWVARNKDAHAWVEAYLEDGKWTIVDSTPASAMPQSVKDPSRSREFLDIIALSFEKIGDNFRRRGLFWLINTAFFKTLAALVFAWYFFGLISKKMKNKKISCEEYSIPEELQYVRKKYYRLEKKLSRKGIIREPGQTLSEFLLKIGESNIDPKKKQDFIWFIEFYMFERYNT